MFNSILWLQDAFLFCFINVINLIVHVFPVWRCFLFQNVPLMNTLRSNTLNRFIRHRLTCMVVVGRSWTSLIGQSSLPASFNIVDPTMLEDVGSVWMGLYCQQSLHKCGCREGLSCQVTKEFDILGQKIQLRQCMPSSESFSVEHMKEKDVAEMAGGRPKRFLIDVRFYYTVYLTVIYLSFLLNDFVALHVCLLLFVFICQSVCLCIRHSVFATIYLHVF